MTGKFRLDEACSRAYEEFKALKEEEKNEVSVMLISRKFAPKTSKQVTECFDESPKMWYMDSYKGHLLIDVAIAAIGDIIGKYIWYTHSQEVNAKAMEDAKKQMLRDQLVGR